MALETLSVALARVTFKSFTQAQIRICKQSPNATCRIICLRHMVEKLRCGMRRLQHLLTLDLVSQNEVHYGSIKIENEVSPTSYILGYIFRRVVLY